ncbi:hypothetical protein [Niallia circulans]|uniref:hypothetical protein n=1 Tax=Niallia circulans TaxID=1397 RepID=UPI0026EB04DA|nr:hypothetical protein [Niallia circulans]
MFLIRDESSREYNKVSIPAAVYDSRDSVLLKIGEREDMLSYFDLVQNKYRKEGFHVIANDISFMELPKDQVEIDKVFQICDYIGKLHAKRLN